MASLSAAWANQVHAAGWLRCGQRAAGRAQRWLLATSRCRCASCLNRRPRRRPRPPQDAIDKAVTASVGGREAVAAWRVTRLIPFNPVDKKTQAEARQALGWLASWRSLAGWLARLLAALCCCHCTAPLLAQGSPARPLLHRHLPAPLPPPRAGGGP